MTKEDFMQISNDICQKVLKTALGNIDLELDKITNNDATIDNDQLVIILFNESIKISSEIAVQLLANTLEFDD